MSALKFSTFCGNCFATIATGSGIVLSCGDFLCNNCSALEQETCPVCCTTGVRSAKLSHPPEEVVKNMEDPASHLEGIFNTLKFQLSHYKDTLGKFLIYILYFTIESYQIYLYDFPSYVTCSESISKTCSNEKSRNRV